MIDTIAFFVGMFLSPAVVSDAITRSGVDASFRVIFWFIWALSWTIYFN